jgi:hypothetical protein
MSMERDALAPQPQRVPVNRGGHLERRQRIAKRESGERAVVERAALSP